MKYSFRWYVLRWLLSIAMIIDGVVGMISLGFWWTTIELRIDSALSSEFERINK